MELIESSKMKLPPVYFIKDKSELKDIPIGIPFFLGDESIKPHIIRIMEYEVLFNAAMRTGYPFNFAKILKENGYSDLIHFGYQVTAYMEFMTEGLLEDYLKYGDVTLPDAVEEGNALKKYIKDSSCYVDMEKLKQLKVFPVWLESIEEAIKTNIHNFAVFNPNMYNKKLEGMYGALELNAPNRNLIIIDISGSIPRQVSSTTLTLAKNLVETFYADLMITGSHTTLYPYEEMHRFNVDSAYEKNGMNNEAIEYRKLVTSDVKNYETVIAFGDNHSPLDNWGQRCKQIAKVDAQKLCKWNVKKLISFHTTSNTHTAGYADFFNPRETVIIKDWVKYLNK